MLSVFWKCLLRVSSRPYEKPQRKKRTVTRQMGSSDSLSVNSAALVRFLSDVRSDRAFQNWLENILSFFLLSLSHNNSNAHTTSRELQSKMKGAWLVLVL